MAMSEMEPAEETALSGGRSSDDDNQDVAAVYEDFKELEALQIQE